MKLTTTLLNRNYFSKFLLTLALVVFGGGNFVWGQAKKLPYSYNFDDNDLSTNGWSKTEGTSGIYTSANYPAHSGSYAFRFYGTENTQYLISPLLESSTSGTEVSFYYNSFTGTQTRTFNVGYSTTNTEIASFKWLTNDITYTETGWKYFTESFPSSEIKYVAIRHKANSQYQPFFIDDISVSKADPYKTPTEFSCTVTANSATFTWTNPNNNATSWNIKYSTKEDFDPKTEGTLINTTEGSPYLLEGLVDGVTYYAAIRAIYSDGESDWSDNISFTTGALYTLNNDAANTNANVAIPNYTSNSSYLTKSQMIYPNSELSDIKGKYITQLTFYADVSSIDWGTATYDVYLAETTTSSFAYSAVFIEWSNCTKVVEDSKLQVSDGKLVINLTTPFFFSNNNDKNLLIGFAQKTTSASSVSSSWHVKGKTPGSGKYYAAAYYNSGSYTYSNGQGYVPKVSIKTKASTISVTLDDNGFTTFACPRPLDLTTANMPDGLTAYRATVDAANSKVRFTSDINQTVAANTGVLLQGSANTTYNIPFAESGTAVADNDFMVNSTGGTFAADDRYTYFGMKKNSDPLLFATFDPSSVAIPSNKAYLQVLTSSLPSARELTCVFDDGEATGVQELKNARIEELKSYYDLQGRKVLDGNANGQLAKGLYIVNGRKVVIK